MDKNLIKKIGIILLTLVLLIFGIKNFFFTNTTRDSNEKLDLNSIVSSSPITYGRLLEYTDMGWVKQVDLYDNGRNAIVHLSSPELGNRPQTVRVEIPLGSSQLIQKLKEYNIDFDAHPIARKNLIVTIASNLLLPLIFINLYICHLCSNKSILGVGSSSIHLGINYLVLNETKWYK